MQNKKYLNWAKKTKKTFVEDFLHVYKNEQMEAPVAIFMAGLPGAGKTEVSKNFVKIYGQRFVRIDMDEIAEMIPDYKPENASDFREAATLLMNNIIDNVYKNNISFVMDGTFGSPYALKNIERAIKHNYILVVSYIHQDPKRAWDFTVAREKVEKRGIEKFGFVKTFFNVENNMRNLFQKYSDVNVNIFIKNEKNEISKIITNATSSEFDELTKNDYTIDSLNRYISGK